MRPPPSRYKVVERGRRLEVIDTWAARSATPAPASPAERPRDRADRAPRTAPAADVRDTLFTTRRWYDDKAPRAIRESYANKARLRKAGQIASFTIAVAFALALLFAPATLIVLALLLVPEESRRRLRAAATRWIDAFDQAPTGSSAG